MDRLLGRVKHGPWKGGTPARWDGGDALPALVAPHQPTVRSVTPYRQHCPPPPTPPLQHKLAALAKAGPRVEALTYGRPAAALSPAALDLAMSNSSFPATGITVPVHFHGGRAAALGLPLPLLPLAVAMTTPACLVRLPSYRPRPRRLQ